MSRILVVLLTVTATLFLAAMVQNHRTIAAIAACLANNGEPILHTDIPNMIECDYPTTN